jgi:hypothetical protein
MLAPEADGQADPIRAAPLDTAAYLGNSTEFAGPGCRGPGTAGLPIRHDSCLANAWRSPEYRMQATVTI